MCVCVCVCVCGLGNPQHRLSSLSGTQEHCPGDQGGTIPSVTHIGLALLHEGPPYSKGHAGADAPLSEIDEPDLSTDETKLRMTVKHVKCPLESRDKASRLINDRRWLFTDSLASAGPRRCTEPLTSNAISLWLHIYILRTVVHFMTVCGRSVRNKQHIVQNNMILYYIIARVKWDYKCNPIKNKLQISPCIFLVTTYYMLEWLCMLLRHCANLKNIKIENVTGMKRPLVPIELREEEEDTEAQNYLSQHGYITSWSGFSEKYGHDLTQA